MRAEPYGSAKDLGWRQVLRCAFAAMRAEPYGSAKFDVAKALEQIKAPQ